MEEGLVSICWTTHHEPVEMIQKSLDSLDNQTYENIEVIMVNDCSIIPGVSEFLDYYDKTHNKFRYIELNENVGFAKAKNIGAMAAKGEYFMFVDADQELAFNSVKYGVNKLQTDNTIMSVGWPVTDNYVDYVLAYINDYNNNRGFLGIGSSIFRYELFYRIGFMKDDIRFMHGQIDVESNTGFYSSDSEWAIDAVTYCCDNGYKCICADDYIGNTNAFTYNCTIYNRKSNTLGEDKKALFLDRDGVINELMPNYVKSVDEFHILPGVIEAIKILRTKFDYIFIVTNQQCVGKGLITEDVLIGINEHFNSILSSNNTYIDHIYYCTDLEESGSNNRKPNTGMGIQAKNQYLDFDFSKSYMVGDMNRDAEFGNRLGMKSVIVNRSEDITQPIIGEYKSLYDFAISLD